jgi:serine/threonine-protein kinase RsbW
MPNKLRFSLPGSKDSVSAVRLAVASYANSSGFSLLEVEDICVAISEACKIICCHGHDRLACRFLVLVGMEENVLHISMSDNNGEFTIEKGECPRCGHCPEDGDLAMFILSSLMDKVELSDQPNGGKILVMEKKKVL